MHTPVLLHEAIHGLDIKPGNVFLDATVGGGGHSELICKTFGDRVTIVGLDQDEWAIKSSADRLANTNCKFTARRGNFRNLDKLLDELGIKTVDRILFDLGTSAHQLEESDRGFSWKRVEPLLMTMPEASSETGLTAKDIVNSWEGKNIALILETYGDERFANRIAQAIVDSRKEKPIETTGDLEQIISNAVPAFYRMRKIHPATKTFQALRIAINDEVRALEEGIAKGFARLTGRGRMGVIAFHSLEDRIIKRFFKRKSLAGEATLVTKKPITPSQAEIKNNPRSRSAKLRIIEKIQI